MYIYIYIYIYLFLDTFVTVKIVFNLQEVAVLASAGQ